MTYKDLTSQVFGKLTVLEFAGHRGTGAKRRVMWRCRCGCGSECEVSAKHLRGGSTRSCGCLANGNPTHGATRTPEFAAWQSMLHRCRNPNNRFYSHYGARGIRVCERWTEAFENFLADMGPRPAAGMSLDRINNDGNYEPGNCRWATSATQGANKRNNRRLEFNGETLTLSQWSRRTGLAKNTIRNRLGAGWPLQEALTRGFSQGQRGIASPPKESQCTG